MSLANICYAAEFQFNNVEKAFMATLYSAKTFVVVLENTVFSAIESIIKLLEGYLDTLNSILKSWYDGMLPNKFKENMNLLIDSFCNVLSKCSPLWQNIFGDFIAKDNVPSGWTQRNLQRLKDQDDVTLKPIIYALEIANLQNPGMMDNLVEGIANGDPIKIYNAIEGVFCRLSVRDLIFGDRGFIKSMFDYYEGLIQQGLREIDMLIQNGLAEFQNKIINAFSYYMNQINLWAECAFSMCNFAATAANLKDEFSDKMKYIYNDSQNNWAIKYSGKLDKINSNIVGFQSSFDNYLQDKLKWEHKTQP